MGYWYNQHMDEQDHEQSEIPQKNVFSELKKVFSKEKLYKAHNRYFWPIATLLGGLRPLHHWAIGQIARIQEGQKVLEVGSGYPLYKLYSRGVGKGGIFIALDIDPVIQERSQKIGYWIDRFLNQKDHSPETMIAADANQIPFAKNSFDTVIASNFTAGSDYIGEALRVLKPGGRLITAFTETGTIPKVCMKEADLACKAGFSNIKIERSMPANIIPGFGWNYYVEATKPASE